MKKTIREVAESYGVRLWPIGEGMLRGSCPMHKNVNTPSFTIYEGTDSYFCFGEGIGGNAANLISHMEGISYAEAKKRVDGEVTFEEDFTQLMDSASVIEETDYAIQLNFAVSRYCRDLLIGGKVQVDNILKFLQRIDTEVLTKPVTRDILRQEIEESRRLS